MKKCLVFFCLIAMTAKANELNYQFLKTPASSPSMTCDFIFDHYPNTKFCSVIYNKSHQKLHIMRDDGMEMDLDPTISGVLFETVAIEKRYFSIKSDTSRKIIVMASRNREGIKCKDDTNNIKNSFFCETWV